MKPVQSSKMATENRLPKADISVFASDGSLLIQKISLIIELIENVSHLFNGTVTQVNDHYPLFVKKTYKPLNKH